MNKKRIIKTLGLAAVVIISGYGGMKTYQSHTDNVNLLLENVEAMSQVESQSDFTQICNVPADPIWCNVHYQLKWTYTKQVTTHGTCICTAAEHNCCN